MTSALALDRRSLIKLGGGAALALGLPALPAPAVRAETADAAARLVLVDRRYWESVWYAEGLAGLGAEVLPLGRDLARLWYGQIAPRLASRPFILTGVTLPADLFGLERLAESSGGSRIATLHMKFSQAPRRGSPKHFTRWTIRWGAGEETEAG